MQPTAPRKRYVSDSVRSVFLAAAMAAGLDEVAAGGSISGTIFNPDGSPAAGVDVTATRTIGLPLSTVTNAQGQYTFLDPSSGCYSLMASSPTFGAYFRGDTILEKDQEILDFVSTTDVTGINIRAQFGSRLVGGVIRRLTPNPSDSVQVGLETPEGSRTAVGSSFTETSPGEYSFTLVNVPAGDWVVKASWIAGGFPWYDGDTSSVFEASVTTVGSADVTGTEINLPAVPVVGVTVKDQNGDPRQGQLVGVFEVSLSSPSGLNFTDASGVTTIPMPGLAPGSQVLINSYGTTSQPFFGNRDGNLNSLAESFVLSAGDNLVALTVPLDQGAVTGHLATAGTGTAIPFGSATLAPAVPNGRLHLFTWERNANFLGDWAINGGVPPGWYVVTARGANAANDFHVQERSAAFLVGSTVAQDSDLQVGGRVHVHAAVQGSGGPVLGAAVRLFDANCEWIATGLSGFDGIYRSPNVDVGSYIACAEASGFEKRCSSGATSCQGATPFNVAASAITNTQLDLPALTVRRVSGTLKDAAGNPVPFTEIAQGAFIFPLGSVITNECGDFFIEGVPGQIFTVAVTHPEKGNFLANITIGNTDRVQDLTLVPWSSAVWGRVTDDEDNPLLGVELCLDSERHCTESDSQGYYRLGSQPGAHRLWATGDSGYDRRVYDGLQIGATPLRQDVPLVDVPADAHEVNDLTTSLQLQFGIRYQRSFSSAEDVDWQSFGAQQGKYYRFRFFGDLIDEPRFSPNVAIFNDATKTLDRAGAQRLLEGTFTTPVSGTYRVGTSWHFAGPYEMELTQSDMPPGPRTPTVGSINPTSGPAAGGTAVTIKGTNFEPNATVWFGGQWATNVTVVDDTTITCWTPALGAGALYNLDVDNPANGPLTVGPRRPAVTGTLAKAWFADFGDVALAFIYHNAIEKIFRAGITTGCGGGNYCPNDPITRDAMAAFILRAKHGGAYVAPDPTGDFWEDVKTNTFLARWMEQFGREQITTGCGTTPGASLPNYCATAQVTRDGMSVFLLRGKNGSSFLPPVATGDDFCDVLLTTFLARWMEQLKVENITQGCGSVACPRLGGGLQPNFCPLGTVTRGEMAPFLVRAFGL